MRLYCDPTGSLTITFIQDGTETVEFVSQPLQLNAPGKQAIAFSRRDGVKKLRLGPDVQVKELNDEPKETLVVKQSPLLPLERLPSYRHPDARIVCANKMEERQRRHSQPPNVPPGARPATLAEQLCSLELAVTSVRETISAVVRGQVFRLGELATVLRNLVITGSRYDPELLRLATRLDLPLPVYKPRRAPHEILDIIRKCSQVRVSLYCSVMERYPTSELADLEDLLRVRLCIERPSPPQTWQPRSSTLSDIIEKYANTKGSAHHLQFFHINLESLESTTTGNTNLLADILVKAGTVIADLGDYLLNEARNRGIIPPRSLTDGPAFSFTVG